MDENKRKIRAQQALFDSKEREHAAELKSKEDTIMELSLQVESTKGFVPGKLLREAEAEIEKKQKKIQQQEEDYERLMEQSSAHSLEHEIMSLRQTVSNLNMQNEELSELRETQVGAEKEKVNFYKEQLERLK